MNSPDRDVMAPVSNLPPETPSWITQQLVDTTLAVWQPYYENPLTVEDAIDMLLHVGSFVRLLRENSQARLN